MSADPPRTTLKYGTLDVAWQVLSPSPSANDNAEAAKKGVRAMDLWYELAIREMGDLNEEASEILREAEEKLLVPADDADEEDE